MRPVIEIESLSKRYRIGAVGYTTLRETFNRLWTSKNKKNRAPKRDLWALQNVSFSVQKGEIVGILGRNGAGKSTLLKVLSRITEPTSGQAVVRGRVASLLEVGTGFHPELTGRENVYLNGALLGMRKAETAKKFDAIVDFSEMESMIDTPVKHYSSGMYVRLAFAVAAHLESEILFADEVLAVGDSMFQKKCLGKMDDVAQQGRTVLFVSHNMPSVLRLCQRCVILQNGRLTASGPAGEMVQQYIKSAGEPSAQVVWPLETAPGNLTAKITAIRVLNPQGRAENENFISRSVTLEMEFWCSGQDAAVITPSFHVNSAGGTRVFSTAPYEDPVLGKKSYARGFHKIHCIVPACFFNYGHYTVSGLIMRNINEVMVIREDAVSFRMNDDGVGRGGYTGEWGGVVRPLFAWEWRFLGEKV